MRALGVFDLLCFCTTVCTSLFMSCVRSLTPVSSAFGHDNYTGSGVTATACRHVHVVFGSGAWRVASVACVFYPCPRTRIVVSPYLVCVSVRLSSHVLRSISNARVLCLRA